MFQVRRGDRKKKKLGKIQINRKKNMKSFLKDYNNDYTDSRYLAKLYTSDDEKFYWSWMDAWKIYEHFSKDKTEVKGNSIRKVAEFIFDNNYNPNFEEENK